MASCRDSSIVDPGVPSSDVPNSVGSFWSYAIYHSFGDYYDTLTISNIGRHTLPNGEVATVATWSYSSDPGTVDTQYVCTVNDTLNCYMLRSTDRIFERYLFPLRVGSYWLGQSANDTSSVAGIDSVDVPAGSFIECYRIERGWPGRNEHPWLTRWVAPSIGVVQWHEVKYEFGPFMPYAYEDASLIRYHLAND
jgi:hypothetical protein